MYQHLKPGNEAGIAIAKCINLAFDGNIEKAANELCEAVQKLVSIRCIHSRQRATDYAVEVAGCWLDLTDDVFPIVEATRSADPFWLPRKPKKTSPEEAASLVTAGAALAKALSQACNGKPSDAVASFPKAVSLLSQLSSVGERFDAADYALQIADRGYEAIATQAWQDLVDAANLIDENTMDLAFSHLVQAIDDLASIPDECERAKAVAMARQQSERVLGQRFQDSLAGIRPLLVEAGFENWQGRFREVYVGLIEIAH